MTTKLLLPLILAGMLLNGCAKQTFYMNGTSTTELNAPTEEGRKFFLVEGVGQQDTRNAAEICGSAANVIAIETHQTVADALLNWATLGIVSPRTYRVYCRA